jgi:hypothetical protein
MEIKFTQNMVIFGHWSFSFENLDGNSLLVILIGSEYLRFLSRNLMVSRDDLSHDSSNSLDTESKRDDI